MPQQQFCNVFQSLISSKMQGCKSIQSLSIGMRSGFQQQTSAGFITNQHRQMQWSITSFILHINLSPGMNQILNLPCGCPIGCIMQSRASHNASQRYFRPRIKQQSDTFVITSTGGDTQRHPFLTF